MQLELPVLCYCKSEYFSKMVEISNFLCPGVSTSFEVGGWKTKVGGCEEARGQRPQGTRGVRGMPPMEMFEIWSVYDAFSTILAKKLRLLEHC